MSLPKVRIENTRSRNYLHIRPTLSAWDEEFRKKDVRRAHVLFRVLYAKAMSRYNFWGDV